MPCGWPFAFVLGASDIEATQCLRFIDEYGDTVFNQLQAPVLIRELENAAAAVSDLTIHAQYESWKRKYAGLVPSDTALKSLPPLPPLITVRRCARDVISLAQRCQAEVHTYLKFVGD